MANVNVNLKRQSDDDLLPVPKIQRIEHNAVPTSPLQRQPNNDFSGSVKRKLADSKRTGQACDRCKVRPRCSCGNRMESAHKKLQSLQHVLLRASLYLLSHVSCDRRMLLHRARNTDIDMTAQQLRTRLNHSATTQAHHTNTLLLGPQNSMRRTTRRLHTMRAEQNPMSHHRPHHRSRYSARPC
jgi:hypothetical protein